MLFSIRKNLVIHKCWQLCKEHHKIATLLSLLFWISSAENPVFPLINQVMTEGNILLTRLRPQNDFLKEKNCG